MEPLDTAAVEREANALVRLGIAELRAEQKSVLQSLRQGNSVLALLPTGFGKSVCYQLPAMLWGWRVIVISPLLSLIEDQKIRAQQAGLRALALHSQLAASEKSQELGALLEANWDILFISPERLHIWMRSGFWERLRPQVSLLVLDEVHCFVDWADFRPAFAALDPWFRDPANAQIPILALSASLEPNGAVDLVHRWGRNFLGIRSELGRHNINIRVLPIELSGQRFLALASLLKNLEAPHTAIIYCGTRREAEVVASFLSASGWPAVHFHAGMPGAARKKLLHAFRAGRLRIVCATSAFGLGVDYPLVDRVVHWGTPSDIASYWQEVGRAGRGSQPASATLLWCRSDQLRLRYFYSCVPEADRLWHKKNLLAQLEYLRTKECRKKFISRFFGWEISECGNCDNCHAKNSPHEGETQKHQRIVFPKPWWYELHGVSPDREIPEMQFICG